MHPDYSDYLNNLHYFYSTAPQVLGAILAITGAFVVFKVDSLKKVLFSRTQKIIDQVAAPKNPDFSHVEADEYFKKLYESVNQTTLNTFFKVAISEIKYAQIAKDAGTIKSIFEAKEKEIEDEFDILKNLQKEFNNRIYEDNYTMLIGLSSSVLRAVEAVESFTQKTKKVYITNGILLGVLLCAFVIIPDMVCSPISYWITLISGLCISLLSLGLIIRYLMTSVGDSPGNEPSPAKQSGDQLPKEPINPNNKPQLSKQEQK